MVSAFNASKNERITLSPANFLENYKGEPIIVSSFAGAASIEQYLLELDISPNTIVKLYS